MNAPLPTLYVLAAEYRQSAESLADLDLPDEVISDTLEGLAGDFAAKATNIAMLSRNLEATAAQIKEAESAMAARRRAIESRADRLRSYIMNNMQKAGIQNIECPYFRLSIRENPASVFIVSAEHIPVEFMRQHEPPPPSPDKRAIAEAIKAGREVPGASMTSTQRLEIK